MLMNHPGHGIKGVIVIYLTSQLGFISFFLYAALFQGVTCCVLIEKNTSRVAQTTYVSSWLSGSTNIVFTFDGALFQMSYVLFKSLVGQFSLSLAHFY